MTSFPDDRGMHAMPSSFLDKIDSRCQSAVEFKKKMMGRHDSARMSQEKSYAQLLKMDKARRQKEAKQRARKGYFKKQKLELWIFLDSIAVPLFTIQSETRTQRTLIVR